MSDPNLRLAAASRDHGNAPALTWYGEDQSRIELSFATLANAVAKTAGFLQDELELLPGDDLVLQLGSHWQTSVWLGACAAVGVEVDLRPPERHGQDAAALVGFSLPELSSTLSQSRAGVRVLVSESPFGLPGAAPPADIVDHAREVMSFPDTFFPEPDAQKTVAISDNTGRYGVGQITDLVSNTQQNCRSEQNLQVGLGTAILTQAPPQTQAGWLALWALPTFLGTHGVICQAALDPVALADLIGQEDVALVLADGAERNQYGALDVPLCVVEQ